MIWALATHLAHFTGPLINAVRPPTWGEMGVYFVALVAVCGTIYTATVTRRNGREANAITFSAELMDEVKTLKTDVKGLQDAQKETAAILSAWTVFTEQLFRWGRGGGGEPEPTVPARLRDQLAHLIDDREEA